MSGSVFLTALCVSLMIALMFANPLAKPRIREPVRSRALPSWLPPLLVLVGSSVLIGGALGIALGVLLAIASGFALPRFESAIGRRDRLARERQLPLFVDLVAACLSSGVTTDDALMDDGAAVGAPLSEIVTTAVTSGRPRDAAGTSRSQDPHRRCAAYGAVGAHLSSGLHPARRRARCGVMGHISAR